MRSFTKAALALAAATLPVIPAQAAEIVLLDTDCVLATGCLFSGNATDEPASVVAIETAYNTQHVPLPVPGIDLTGLYKTGGSGGGTNGTFTLPGGGLFSFYAVKAADYFMLYQVAPTNSIDWTTAGIPHNGKPNKDGTPKLHEMSHITVYSSVDVPDQQGAVPEPSTWAMMLFGFGGIGFAMRRRKSEGRGHRLRVAYA